MIKTHDLALDELTQLQYPLAAAKKYMHRADLIRKILNTIAEKL